VGRLVGTLALLGGLVFLPTTAFAQATIAGTARDASGGVLPWVTVEAASPVLIEKSRTTVTDGNGQFQIIDLRPGTYTVTFTLAGFNTCKREAIELTGSLTAVVDAELRVGAVEEAITVAGEAPVGNTMGSLTPQGSRAAGMFHNTNAFIRDAWTYATTRRALPAFTGSHNPKVDLTDTQNQPDTTEGYKLLVRGFIAMQIDHDQHDMGDSQPLFPPRVPLPSTLRFTANQTQLGFGLEAPPTNGWTNRVYVELDFLSTPPVGADRLTTREPRMRQAFWMLGWSEDRNTLLVGQAPVLYGYLDPNITWDNLSLTLGALAGREPQVRYTHLQPRSDTSALIFAASVDAPNSGLLSENTGSAERSRLPSVQAKLAYDNANRGTVNYFGFEDVQPSPMEIAVSGFLGAEKPELLTREARRIVADGVAVSAIVPIVGIRDNKRRAGAVGVIAQGWIGKNIDAYFGGNGQGIYETAAGRVDGVVGRGFFAGANAFVSQNIWLSAFYSYEKNNLPDLVDAGIPFRIASGAFRSSTFDSPGVGHGRDGYAAIWFNPLPSLYTSVGWDYRQASYNDGPTGRNNRFNLSVFYNFCSAQADRLPQLPWVCRTGGQTRDVGNPREP
jgi:hypothetical protein